MLEISEHSPDVIRLSGRFDGAGAALFDPRMRALEARSSPLALDFEGVGYLSSAGIRSLVMLEKRLRAKGARLILVALQSQVAQSLETSGLLKEFAVAASVGQARALMGDSTSGVAPAAPSSLGGRAATVRRLPASPSQIVVWGPGGSPSDPASVSQALRNAILAEIPLAIGRGGFGNNRQEAMESFGDFMAAGTTAILAAANAPDYPDFLQSDQPEAVSLYVAEAAAIRGRPALFLRLEEEGMTWGEFAAALPVWAGKLMGSAPSDLAFLLSTSLPGAPDPEDMLALGFVTAGAHDQPPPLRGFRQDEWISVSPSARLLGRGIRLAGHRVPSDARDPEALLSGALAADRLLGVAPLRPETPIGRALAWIYLPEQTLSSEETRLNIEVGGTLTFPDEWELIARRIYTEARRVVLTPMSGGYSATTMRADSYDAEGRRMIPTVLKISSRQTTNAEVRAYHEHVKKFILNNSTVIMGHASQGDWSGLRYNFVGVNGPGSTLSWLADQYLRRPTAALMPLVDAVFGQVLWPWYGQSKREILRPFEQHAPPLHFFPDIPGEAERTQGIPADAPSIRCEELGRDLPNPYHFLRHAYPKLKTLERPWHTSITHGDLNLNNILVDEKDNIYIIDFSETRPRNALSDFARIEPVITLQIPRLEDRNDMRDLLVFWEGLASVSPLKGDPPLRYAGSDPMVEKAWHVLCRLRAYARKAVGGEDQPLFYWLPLLEWTLPGVYFQQLGPERKRLWTYVSALLCEQIQALV